MKKVKEVKWTQVWDNYNGMDKYLSKGGRFEINNFQDGIHEWGGICLIDRKKNMNYEVDDVDEAKEIADALKNKQYDDSDFQMMKVA